MPKTKDKLTGAAGTAKPYVERALHDEELRAHVKQAYSAARDLCLETGDTAGLFRSLWGLWLLAAP